MEPPIFLTVSTTKKILDEVKNLVPPNTQVYLFAGAIRNAIYYHYLNQTLPQRDFDCIVIGDRDGFVASMLKANFIFGNRVSPKAKVMKKARVESPTDNYTDWLYLDCKFYSHPETITTVLEKIADFTINGVALDVNDIDAENWLNKIIYLPGALDDIKNKKLRVVTVFPGNFFKIIRLTTQGFSPPTKEEIELCVRKIGAMTDERFHYHVAKTFDYVGGEEKARQIARDLGVGVNVFDLETVRNII